MKRDHLVLTDKQVAVLSSAIRQEIFFGLIQIEEASVNELAIHTGRTPKSLYHHIRQLSETGLIVQIDTRRSGAREEAIYAPISTSVKIPRNETTVNSINSIMRLTAREQLRSFDSKNDDKAMLFRIGLKLTQEDQTILKEKVNELSEWAQSRATQDGERISLTIAFAPLEVEHS